MALRTLPIIEHWDCHNCGICCYGNIIRLDEDDLSRLKAQRWDEHPEYRGKRTIAGHGLFKKTYTLVQRPDGGCLFLTPQGRCRIHEVHGYEAKPRICKTFPLQIVPIENGAVLTTRRSCPSAAADKGRAVTEHVANVEKLLASDLERAAAQRPPTIVSRHRRDWADTRKVTGGARAADGRSPVSARASVDPRPAILPIGHRLSAAQARSTQVP